MRPRVGICAIQGDFEKHGLMVAALGAPVVEVRTPQDLEQVERLILPGGESTTVGLLMQKFGLGKAIVDRASQGMPVWGTCMGMILMAKVIENSNQFSLGLLDIMVRRNAYGAQVFSFEDEVPVPSLGEVVTGVFIRAPIVTRIGPDVEVLARYKDEIVAVKQGRLFGTSFHPELTEDDRFHRLFLDS